MKLRKDYAIGHIAAETTGEAIYTIYVGSQENEAGAIDPGYITSSNWDPSERFSKERPEMDVSYGKKGDK